MNLIFLKNLIIFQHILNFYKNNFNYKLIFPIDFKYSWVDSKTDYNKFFFNNTPSYKFVEFYQYKNIVYVWDKYHFINNYIKFKNKHGLFKKINSYKNMYLSKYNLFKSNQIKNINLNKDSLNFKNFDFIEKKLIFYKNNRKLLKNFFKKNKKISYYINIFLKKLSKLSLLNYLNFFEFSLSNILINSNFFSNKNDVFYFIKNNYIYINNSVSFDSNRILNKNDLITVCYNKYFFFLYRDYSTKINSNINKYGNFFKKRYNNKIENDFNFVNKLNIITNDVPKYLEIDYLSMSLVILNKNIINYNCFDLKILTVFLRRLNNWKFII